MIIKDLDLDHLASKGIGCLSSFFASHLVWLTTTQDYAAWWTRIYMTAPKITDVPAFERMVSAAFMTWWLIVDHFFWQFKNKQKPKGEPQK